MAKEQYMQSGNGFRFSWLAAFWGLMLLLGLLSAPASAATFSFASGSGSETISSASTASWTDNNNHETLQFSVTGAANAYGGDCDGLIGVDFSSVCWGVDEWLVANNATGSQAISVTIVHDEQGI